jgi:hypothetical protein
MEVGKLAQQIRHGGRTPGGIGLFESDGGLGQDVLNEMHLISRSRTKSTALRGRQAAPRVLALSASQTPQSAGWCLPKIGFHLSA